MLKWIKITDYKCFKGFEVSGFKRVNLITGKNNIGKSALLEAITIHLGTFNFGKLNKVISYFYNRRYDTNSALLFKMITSLDISSNINKIIFSVDAKEQKYILNVNNNKMVQKIENNILDIENSTHNIRYLQIGKAIESLIVGSYVNVLVKDKENEVNRLINKFDSSIIKFQIIKEKAFCSTKNGKMSINEFGAGLKDYILIVCSLISSENGYLFMDELENGMHYTRLDDLWKIIFKLAKELNIQVFITTHSKECIESYYKVLEKNEYEDVSLIELGLNGTTLNSITYEYSEILHQSEQDQSLRGW